MILFLDIETTFQIDEKGRKDPTPYNSNNYIVSAGYELCNEFSEELIYEFYNHNDYLKPENKGAFVTGFTRLQDALNRTTLLIAFNAKFELAWLHALGLKYEGRIADPMIREYVLAKGRKLEVSLEASCIRNKVTHKKSDLVKDYLDKDIGFEVIPIPIVEEYGIGDIKSLKDLYFNQLDRLAENKHLWPTINLMEEFCRCLTDIEDNGIQIDLKELNRLEEEYQRELADIQIQLQDVCHEVMGNIPINLNSSEQLSQILYSRKVLDKNKWKEIFNLGTELRGSVLKPKRRPSLTIPQFVNYIKQYTKPIYKVAAEQCSECKGSGFIRKTKKDGSIFKRDNKCKLCNNGIIYLQTGTIAGFRFIPSSPKEVTIGGFASDNEALERLRLSTENERAKTFIKLLERQNSITTYLTTFIGGIRRGLKEKGILHTSFMQCITATGRLSGRNPNLQNMPRANTFPIRKTIISRFPGGLILSGDAKQLEFRIAGELAKDKQIYQDVIDKIDVHNATSKWTGFNRQDSKPHTFAPVYGATDKGKAENIARYYRYFQERYHELFKAHKEWGDIVLNTGSFILPSGREYIYPNTVRFASGGFSNATIIANYPVQGFATADLMPIYCIETWKLYKQHRLNSLVILEVHDDVTSDVYPGELEIAARLMKQAFENINEECLKRFNYELWMPLEVELKVGPNWMEQKEYII